MIACNFLFGFVVVFTIINVLTLVHFIHKTIVGLLYSDRVVIRIL